MDLRDYFDVLRNRWALVVSVLLGTVALAALYTWQATPQYASTTSLFISTSSADDTQAFQNSQFSLQRVKSYADLVKQGEIADRVIDRLDLSESSKKLSGQISAEAQLDTVILDITVTDPSPKRAQQIAAAVADVFVGYVGELETPPGRDQATIKATITDRADEPGGPVSPQPRRNLGLGVVLGLLLGAGVAILRETLDTSVTSGRQLEEISGAPILGAIPFDTTAGGAPLIADIDTYSPRSESFRVLRTNLQFIDPGGEKKVFVVTSAVPGEGKSTTVCNLALALAESGQRVALVEGDLRRPRISTYLNVIDTVGLTTVLIGRIGLAEALQATRFDGVSVLASGKTPPNPAELLQSRQMVDVIEELRSGFDVVLIDAPPLLPVTDGALIASAVDGAILVVRHGETHTEEVAGAVERLAGVGVTPMGCVMNMVPAKRGGYGYGYGYGYSPLDADKEPAPRVRRQGRRSGSRVDHG